MLSPSADLMSLKRERQWSLVAHTRGDVLKLGELPCQVGRHPGVGVRIVHPTVSLLHAEFRPYGDELALVDLGSRNGTFINGKRVTQQHLLANDDLVQFGASVFRLQDNHVQQNLTVTCQSSDVSDLALALAQFEKLLTESSVIPVYQPIVTADTGCVVAYEALARSRLYGLDKPAQMFRAAEYLHMEAELSRMLRYTELSESSAESLPHLFLNTHPSELGDFKRLILSLREIRRVRPKQPLTLEVHEAAAADLCTMKMLRLALDDLTMKLAYDDFGAGQARLNELVEARPDYVKFDRKLIAGIDGADTSRRKMVESLVGMCRQLGIATLAEGVESAGEANACRQLAFDLMQGYFFGRPAATGATASQPK
jgi:EAL domain-containing protein (putative c-di-GMP-specific phosphodiesterase class I)